MSILKPRQSHIFEPEPHSHYVEDSWVSARLFQEENFGPPGSFILDPACGWGRIPDSAMNALYRARASDIVDRRRVAVEEIEFRKLDFLGLHPEEIYDWWKRHPQGVSIVCNPPFDQVEDFARRALALASHKVAFVFPVRRLPAAHHWLSGTPLWRIWFLTPRPSMPTGSHILAGGKVGGGKQDFCWIVWKKGYTGSPVVAWLHRDREE